MTQSITFQASRRDLADAVAWVSQALPRGCSVPTLCGVRLSLSDSGGLSVSATDLDMSASVQVDTTSRQGTGRVLVDSSLLSLTLRSLPTRPVLPVEMSADDKFLTITCGIYRTRLPVLSDVTYPTQPSMPAPAAGTVNGRTFTNAVTQVAVAASNVPMLPMLSGIKIEFDGSMMTLVATDRYRLAVREVEWQPASPDSCSYSVLVPAKPLTKMMKKLLNGSPEISVSTNTANPDWAYIGLTSGKREVIFRLINAPFVNYRKMMDTEYADCAILPVGQVSDAVKRLTATLPTKETPVVCKLTQGSLSLSAYADDEKSQASEECDVEYSGEPFTIAFTPKFFADGLASIRTSQVRLSFLSPTKLAEMSEVYDGTTAADGQYLHLVMPVRISN